MCQDGPWNWNKFSDDPSVATQREQTLFDDKQRTETWKQNLQNIRKSNSARLQPVV